MEVFKFGSVLGLILMFLSLVLIFIIPKFFWIFLVVGFPLTIYCQSKRVSWQCSECGHRFKISMWGFILGVNVLNSKLLYCDKCKKKTTCKPCKGEKNIK